MNSDDDLLMHIAAGTDVLTAVAATAEDTGDHPATDRGSRDAMAWAVLAGVIVGAVLLL